jgi:hypothetical protein
MLAWEATVHLTQVDCSDDATLTDAVYAAKCSISRLLFLMQQCTSTGNRGGFLAEDLVAIAEAASNLMPGQGLPKN